MIRPAAPHDIEQLIALERGFPATDRFDRRTWRRLLEGQSAAFVAEDGGNPVGAAVVIFRRNTKVGRLYSISVAPGARGRGVARALLDRAEAAACSRDCDRMRLEVRASNSSAIRLYEQNGYRVIARVDSYYPDGEQALRMEKVLTARANGVS